MAEIFSHGTENNDAPQQIETTMSSNLHDVNFETVNRKIDELMTFQTPSEDNELVDPKKTRLNLEEKKLKIIKKTNPAYKDIPSRRLADYFDFEKNVRSAKENGVSLPNFSASEMEAIQDEVFYYYSQGVIDLFLSGKKEAIVQLDTMVMIMYAFGKSINLPKKAERKLKKFRKKRDRAAAKIKRKQAKRRA